MQSVFDTFGAVAAEVRGSGSRTPQVCLDTLMIRSYFRMSSVLKNDLEIGSKGALEYR